MDGLRSREGISKKNCFLLEYSWCTILCQFLLYIKAKVTHIHIFTLF